LRPERGYDVTVVAAESKSVEEPEIMKLRE